MKPPIRKLIGGVEESHTREYLFQISAQTMGCRERSRFQDQEQQEHKTRSKTRVFEKREREGKRRYLPGAPVGPRRLVSAARGWAAPPGLRGQGWTAWSSGASGWVFTYKFLFLFFWNFTDNFTVEKNSKFQKLQKLPWNIKQKLNKWISKKHNFWYSKDNKS